MAKHDGSSIRSILIWTYERGTIQYDIICALILAFILFVPRSCFTAKENPPPAATSQTGQQGAPESATAPVRQ